MEQFYILPLCLGKVGRQFIKKMKLYYHKTDGGAEYLTDTFIPWKHNGKSGKEGTFTDKTKYIVRIDGNIEKDAELTVRENSPA